MLEQEKKDSTLEWIEGVCAKEWMMRKSSQERAGNTNKRGAPQKSRVPWFALTLMHLLYLIDALVTPCANSRDARLDGPDILSRRPRAKRV